MKSLFLAASIVMFGATAQSAVLDFDTLMGFDNGLFAYRANVYEEDGFRLTASPDIGSATYLQWTAAYNADPNGYALSHNYTATTSLLERIGGGVFDLLSICRVPHDCAVI